MLYLLYLYIGLADAATPTQRTRPVLYLVGFAAAAAPPTQHTRRQALRHGVGGAAAAWPLATTALPSDKFMAETWWRGGERSIATACGTWCASKSALSKVVP